MLETKTNETKTNEAEKNEAIEFIEILKEMSETEQAEVRGYMKCLRTIKLTRAV